jgi:hypothetical protein
MSSPLYRNPKVINDYLDDFLDKYNMKEQQHYDRIRAAHAGRGVLFRNNVGTAYQGQMGSINGDRVLLYPRFVEFGLCKGSSDLIGWTEITITPDMVGKRIAVFTAVEVKTKTGRVSDEQKRFIKNVNDAGGIAKIERI